jgi:cation-transporting ATPase I
VREAVLDTARVLARRGLRILAVAERRVDVTGNGKPTADLEFAAQDLELRGLIGLSDRLRDGAPLAVRRLRAAGIRPVIVTGDHPETAAAIAAELGIDTSTVMTGQELARLSEGRRAAAASRTSVFARVSPEQKVAVVRALRHSGAVLAMVGDGVNDAAAIRLADVGIGIGAVDSASARSVAHIVLADNDLGAVVDAVGEGRAMWQRVRDAVAILVGGNAGEIAFSLLGTAVGGVSPVNTRQFLLVNLLTDAFPALAVAVTPPQPESSISAVADDLAGHPFESVLRRGPQAGFSAELRRAVLVRAATTSVGASAAWLTGRLTGPAGRAGTMGLAALVGTQLAQTALVGWRSPLVLLTVAASVLALFVIVQTPVVSQLFGCVPLDPLAWTVVLAASLGTTAGSTLLPRLLRSLPALPRRKPLMLTAGRGAE